MSEVTGRVTVTNVEKDEKFDLNGTCRTVADAVQKFTNGAGFTGSVRLNGREVSDTNTPLRDSDVVMLIARTVAAGGIKGAN